MLVCLLDTNKNHSATECVEASRFVTTCSPSYTVQYMDPFP